MKPCNIGIALSGGGIRAAIFHLGLFKWLAKNGLMEEVRQVSSVSGASLCVGMIYSHNRLKWPASGEFLTTVLPAIEETLRTEDLELSALRKLLVSPGYWNRKVNLVARQLESRWGVYGKLPDLEGGVTWYANCTTYETGKCFRFSREKMGDYVVGYADRPEIPVADAMAASAGFPALIGPYSLRTGDYQWTHSEYSAQPLSETTLHLWDGGVYDNLGLEAIFKPEGGGKLSEGLEFMIVSNASASIGAYHRRHSLSARNLKRMLDISMDQVAALRSRMAMDFILRTGQGMYVKIGNSAKKIAGGCGGELERRLIAECLPEEEARRAMNYPTTLKKPSASDLRMLLRHGYEVADGTYRCNLAREAALE